MSLNPSAVQSIPEETMRVARAAFPHGNAYLTLHDALGTILGSHYHPNQNVR
jgi:transposase